jgi:myo-inositol-1(or 4)-monophosphatase
MTDIFRNPAPVSLTDAELRTYASFMDELAKASADVISPLFRTDLAMDDKRTYDFFDPVTEADKGAEAAIRRLINERFPGHGIYGEEYGQEIGKSPLTWVIDPIDGTRAFVLGLPTWGTLVALHDGARPILGMLNQPFMNERFIGAPQIGLAELRNASGVSTLRTRDCGSLANASLTSTHPSMFDKEPLHSAYEELRGAVRQEGFGGDCYAYGLVALGTHDLVVENTLSAYDIQALIPIIEAAGGVVTSWDGSPADLGGTAIAAGSAKVHAEALAILSQAI